MAKKALPKLKTTKMGDLEEKVDSAPKKRGRPKKMQTAAEVEAAINLKEFQKSEAKLKKEKEKTVSARKLFKTLEVDVQAANVSLTEIGGILKADFAARIDQEKAEIALLQQESSKAKIKAEEKQVESKNLGDKIKGQAAKAVSPIMSFQDKLIEADTFIVGGFFEFLSKNSIQLKTSSYKINPEAFQLNLLALSALIIKADGKIEKKDALLFGVALSFISVFGLYYFSNLISASLLLLTIVFYVFVYTVWLKRKTPQNIVIGGASGALPPVIGWTIATNSLTFEPITLFLIIFYWTPSHFWALSLYKAKDYEKAKIPMLPNTNGVEETKKKIFIYSLFMLPVIILPYYIGFSGKLFLIASLVLTIYYNYICYDLLKFKKNKFEVKKAKKVFSYSIFYLFLIFVLFLIDKLI